MKNLDFIIIGAQKSATTSLFKYLQPHPEIYMPANKEAPFFTDEEAFAKGWQAFVVEHFAGARTEQFWGTATPQYMGDPAVPERIYQQMPDTRLIALLRNPIDRAFSHYTMSRRRSFETEDFDTVVERLTKSEVFEKARKTMPKIEPGQSLENESDHYLVWGEYGRILQGFLDYFPPGQLLVLFMDDIQNTPAEAYSQVVEFIGLNDTTVPANVGKVYHKGAAKRIIPDSWRQALKNNGLFRLFWDLFPERIKRTIRYWYEQKNVRKADEPEGPSATARKKLVSYFAEDIRLVEKIMDRKVPWSEFD
jgi:hypothetical protein